MKTTKKVQVNLRRFLGTLVTVNFLVFWAAPVFLQGIAFRRGLNRIVRPLYQLVDRSSPLRRFASKLVYRQETHVDYFASSLLLISGTVLLLGVVFGSQIAYGSLPWWLVALFYFAWVGPGARCIGTAWTLAHREGHFTRGGGMYTRRLGASVGNIFENYLGVFWGNVPYNFSTAHVLLHHRFNAGKGDPVYVWDLDRTSLSDMMLYQWRFLRYMTGISSLIEFRRQRGVHSAIDRASAMLARGMVIYWICVPTGILALLIGTGSSISSALLFLFLVYLQPLLAMSTFLAIVNVGQHGFLEIDKHHRYVRNITALTIFDGYDDFFGEDQHFAHHFPSAAQQNRFVEDEAGKRSACTLSDGSVFERTSFFEVAMLIHFRRFDRLIRNHYAGSAGRHSVEELAVLFEQRAKRTEMSYEVYEFSYLPRLREIVGSLVTRGTCPDENRGYVYQAQHQLVE